MRSEGNIMKATLKIASIIASIALLAPVSTVKADLVFTYTSGPLNTVYGPDGPGGDGNYITAVSLSARARPTTTMD